MLTLNIEEQKLWDASEERFIAFKPATIQLEHSLISMSKWESIWCKPFLPVKYQPQTGISNHAEELSYIKCMIIGRSKEYVPQILYQQFGQEIQDYINHPSTATKIYRLNQESRNQKIVTTEQIYSWMIGFNIPMECERWHINRLLVLIDICNIREKQAAGKNKLNPRDAARYHVELNKARLAANQ